MTSQIPPRLVDLAVEWPLQYAGESTVIDPSGAPGLSDRIGQVEGYLSATAVAIVWFGPAPGDRPDPWREANDLMVRVEAEFAGRLLIGPADLGRLEAEPDDALTWAVAGLRGVASLARSDEDGVRLSSLIDRGVRALRLAGPVGRPAPAGDESGLDEPGRRAIAVIASASPVPVLLDLAGLGPRAAGEAITEVEATGRPIVPIVSLGGAAEGTIAGLPPDTFRRLQMLGGVVGLCPGGAFHPDADAFLGSITSAVAGPGDGPPAIDALALGTGFLGIDDPIAGLGTAPEIRSWLAAALDADLARRLAASQAFATISRVVPGAPARESNPGDPV